VPEHLLIKQRFRCVNVVSKTNLSFSGLFHHTVSISDHRAATADLQINGEFDIMWKEALAKVSLGIYTCKILQRPSDFKWQASA